MAFAGVRMDQPGIQPEGVKYAPNHLFTMQNSEFGPVYLDPAPADGYPFKLFGNQSGAIPLRAGAAGREALLA